MDFHRPSLAELRAAAALPSHTATGLSNDVILTEIEAGRLKPEWSCIATSDDGDLIGRAMWWGRDSQEPIALDIWDVAPGAPEPTRVLSGLLTHGRVLVEATNGRALLPHTLRVPVGWRDRPEVAETVQLKMQVASANGLGRANERLQFQWDEGGMVPPGPARLRFTPASDEAFTRLFADAAAGSLDVMTARELEQTTAADLARDEVAYYLSCPGERSWWRVAQTHDGEIVGLAIPSATPTNRNVGYLAVLPQHRGHGHVDEILAYITRFHIGDGARRITATTDAVNTPMAAAFDRAGYKLVEVRIDLEPSQMH
ncbi:GNAT family N-acetyltransferase [Micrococcus luteus]|uniref:GNAT family N-acetyltransferase n=1 Tax=Micrococcus TaxID=1269 RepID=UPI001167D6E2|nr:GNAT family N-acetyltransferase [Micrococcus luteus]MCT2324667.1 GNAT family N-acetyltransferase [Micrococcus luteus]TPE34949.1 GNAT family N-acetyltransferase [Micrococcus luteus]